MTRSSPRNDRYPAKGCFGLWLVSDVAIGHIDEGFYSFPWVLGLVVMAGLTLTWPLVESEKESCQAGRNGPLGHNRPRTDLSWDADRSGRLISVHGRGFPQGRTGRGTLKPEYATALKEVELKEASLADYARKVGITPGNAAVRLHRAREALRKQIVRCCGTCADHGCEGCTCKNPS